MYCPSCHAEEHLVNDDASMSLELQAWQTLFHTLVCSQAASDHIRFFSCKDMHSGKQVYILLPSGKSDCIVPCNSTDLGQQLFSGGRLQLQGRLQGTQLLLHAIHSSIGLVQLGQAIDQAFPGPCQLSVLLAQH